MYLFDKRTSVVPATGEDLMILPLAYMCGRGYCYLARSMIKLRNYKKSLTNCPVHSVVQFQKLPTWLQPP